ncbi:Na+/H+ antiporter subunit E [Nitrosomonas communis]|uniref:Multicomponent Na+:H+ antiporter subunit E n=1 Tax=Nitrosomonas communis TaxID=44574 RepID=A0A1I4KKT4_9PROT|nr:Na+/H+ antiporter subunit E [Nitrosomonas communis]SFL79199.1 multicomponent Na+:H+ antiporter subunit E [Nitrosomonas communis]
MISLLRTTLYRSMFFTAVWWILIEGKTDSWFVGLISISLALVTSFILLPPNQFRFSFTGFAHFLIYFFGLSLKGGIAVACMAIRPNPDLHPNIFTITPRLPEGLGRAILTNTLNLLPGTLSVDLTLSSLYIHVLDERQSIETEVRSIEEKIAHMLRLELKKS